MKQLLLESPTTDSASLYMRNGMIIAGVVILLLLVAWLIWVAYHRIKYPREAGQRFKFTEIRKTPQNQFVLVKEIRQTYTLPKKVAHVRLLKNELIETVTCGKEKISMWLVEFEYFPKGKAKKGKGIH